MSIIVGYTIADNLLTNGDFEQELDVGWQQSISGEGFIDRSTLYDPDPDYEAGIYQSSCNGTAILEQVIEILNEDLPFIEFSCNAKMYAYDNVPGDWIATAVIISYINEFDSILGETRIYSYSDTACPWADSPTLHLIEVADADWHSYFFNLEDELTHLPGVNQLEIKKIGAGLFTNLVFSGG